MKKVITPIKLEITDETSGSPFNVTYTSRHDYFRRASNLERFWRKFLPILRIGTENFGNENFEEESVKRNVEKSKGCFSSLEVGVGHSILKSQALAVLGATPSALDATVCGAFNKLYNSERKKIDDYLKKCEQLGNKVYIPHMAGEVNKVRLYTKCP